MPDVTVARLAQQRVVPRWWLIALPIALTTFEAAKVAIGPFSLQMGQATCLVLLVVAFTDGWISARLASAGALLVGVAWLCALPSIVHFGTARMQLPLQLSVNMLCFLAIASAADRVSERGRMQITRGIFIATVILVILGLAAHGTGRAAVDSRLLAIPRPSAFFAEPTWLAIMLACIVAVALEQRLKWVAVMSTVLALGLDTRTALVLIGVAWLAYIVRRRILSRSVTPLFLVAIWGFATWQFINWFSASSNPTSGDTNSLDTRALDIAATLRANNGLFPFGGPQLNIYDAYRARTLPATSNVWPFDMIWKLGIGGIVLIIATICFFTIALPRVGGIKVRHLAFSPAGTLLLLALPACVFNNAFGRPWFWTMLALAYSAVMPRAASAHPHGSSNRLATNGRPPHYVFPVASLPSSRPSHGARALTMSRVVHARHGWR